MEKDNSPHIRTSQIMIGKSHPAYRHAGRCCQIVRRIKNATHYLIRHVPNESGQTMQHREADKWLKKNNRELYTKLPSSFSQRSTQICGQEWSSYIKAVVAYKKSKKNFTGKPKKPKYANKATTVHIGRNGFQVIKGVIHFAGDTLPPIKTPFNFSQTWNALADHTIAKEVRIVPKGSCYAVELIYDISKLEEAGSYCRLLDTSRQAGIDLGINNLIAIATNQHDIAPVLIKGTALKSINAWYNKRVAQLRSQDKFNHIVSISQKRNRRIKDATHKASSHVLEFCLRNNIGTLVIGHNKGWKQNVGIGKVNNQKFVAIPHAILIKQIQYKCKAAGIFVTVREESYTSKASALDLDFIPTRKQDENVKPLFSGKRTNRGLYKTTSGIINADVNAALNILRKECGDAAMPAVRGVVFTPVSYSPAHVRTYDTRREDTALKNVA